MQKSLMLEYSAVKRQYNQVEMAGKMTDALKNAYRDLVNEAKSVHLVP